MQSRREDKRMSKSASNSTESQEIYDTTVDVDVERQAEHYIEFPGDGGIPNRVFKERIFCWLRRHKKKTESFHLKTSTHKADSPTYIKQATILRTQAIILLFQLSPDHLAIWPGILAFCAHLESCFEELLHPRFNIIWKILRRDTPSHAADCWYWCFAVIKTFQALEDEDTSMEKAYQRLMDNSKMSLHEVKPSDKTEVLRAMFAVLCWTSATLKPFLDDEQIVAATHVASPRLVENSLAAENSSHVYHSKDLRRPVSKLFYSFRSHAADFEELESHLADVGGQNGGGSGYNDMLYESSLNYFSLFTIGRVKLKWVDTLTGHLAFDHSTRTLSIFRFPSFCATNVLCNHNVKVLKTITANLLPSNYYVDSPQEASALYREILLSYRLLFGQSSNARKLLGKLLSQSSTAAARGSTAHSDDIDPFLSTICTSPLLSRWWHRSFTPWKEPCTLLPGSIFPSSALDLNHQLQECDTYTVRDDFPVFGPRLLTLQRYNMRQQPRRVRDLWRDRRNPLQWYTFWAVLWIGGVTIILAVLQLAVGVAQVYTAVHP